MTKRAVLLFTEEVAGGGGRGVWSGGFSHRPASCGKSTL